MLSHVVVHQDVCVRGRVAGADPQGGGSGHCLLGPAEHGIRSTTGPRYLGGEGGGSWTLATLR